MTNHETDVLIVGAGPAGLATAIALKGKGIRCIVLDKGSVADAIRRFPAQMTFFSTSELLEIGNVPFLSAAFRPTRVEAVRYYQRVAHAHSLDVRTNVHVTSIMKNCESFTLNSSEGVFTSRFVVVATGYFDSPNEFNVPGMELSRVHRYYTEPFSYDGRKVAIVGGRNSAVEMALDLFRHGAMVTLIHRGEQLSDGVKSWILPDIQNRMKAGEIVGLFGTRVAEIRSRSLVLTGSHAGEIPNDDLFVMIGYSPQNDILRNVGVEIEVNTAIPRHSEESFETNISGLYVAGSVAAGRFNNKVFIENGRLHGQYIASDVAKK